MHGEGGSRNYLSSDKVFMKESDTIMASEAETLKKACHHFKA